MPYKYVNNDLYIKNKHCHFLAINYYYKLVTHNLLVISLLSITYKVLLL